MIPKAAIEKAIEGGGDGKKWASMHRGKVVEGGVSAYWEVIALDPTFWQSLGKALGWIDKEYPNGEMRCANKLGRCEERYCGYAGFQNPNDVAMRFYDLILTNGDTAAFWKELLPEGTLPANEKEV